MGKNSVTKMAAIIALFAIIISIVWTWILVLLSAWNSANAPTFDVEEFMKNYSGSVNTASGDIILGDTQTWTINE